MSCREGKHTHTHRKASDSCRKLLGKIAFHNHIICFFLNFLTEFQTDAEHPGSQMVTAAWLHD